MTEPGNPKRPELACMLVSVIPLADPLSSYTGTWWHEIPRYSPNSGVLEQGLHFVMSIPENRSAHAPACILISVSSLLLLSG